MPNTESSFSPLKISVRAEQAFFARFPGAEQSGTASPVSRSKALYSQMDQADDTLLLNSHPLAEDLGFRHGVQEAYSPHSLFNQGQRQLSEDLSSAFHLPRPSRLRLPLDRCLFRRRSRRQFAPSKNIKVRSLSTLLYYSAGRNGQQQQWFSWQGSSWQLANHFHTYPSAGGLYPIHLYLRVQGNRGLPDGWYRYQALSHSLLPLPQADIPPSQDPNIEAERAPLWAIFVHQVWRSRHKYGRAAASFALIETGAMVQNLYLVCEALGWACCSWGSFPRQACERALRLDGLSEQALHAVCIGGRA